MKLKKQLESGSRDAKWLMAGMTSVAYLTDSHTRADTSWSALQPFGSGLDGIIRVTMSGSSPKFWAQERFTMRTVRFRRSTSLPWPQCLNGTCLRINDRERLLGGPWDFASWLGGTKFPKGSTPKTISYREDLATGGGHLSSTPSHRHPFDGQRRRSRRVPAIQRGYPACRAR